MFSFPDKMIKVFKDDAMQAEFEKNGYVTVPFYNEAEIAELNKLYEDLHPTEETGFFPSTFSRDKDYRQKADKEIRRIGNRTISEILCDYAVVCGSFIVKYPGEESIMPVHQDMTLVDETEFTGINIWVPLIDLTDDNGVLYALPGSHRLFPTYRGSTVPNIYDDVMEDIRDFMTPVYLKAGEAIIFDQSIIHCSPPNVSNGRRIVTNTYFTHKDARFRTAYYNPEAAPDKVELFEQDQSFMTDFEQFGNNIYDRPSIGKSLGLFDYDFPKITEAQLEDKYERRVKKEEEVEEVATQPQEDNRSFWQVYSPANVVREIKHRITGS